ncbi:hypothetical protein C2S51_008193 [Perilla frutescens var. frutescens]|nr:hypothetical protein C2S51_008193 [Perilla frutescens var. frutescens]
MASSSCVVTESESHRLAGPERVITELNRGREIADRLRRMLREAGFDGSAGSVAPAQRLVSQLLDTFTHSLSMLRDASDSDEVSQVHSAAAAAALKSEDSGESCKTPAPKDRRGCYKRKRNSDTWTKETPNLLEDGYAWRKYGQKVILNAKHPRNYFRCTHKFDQECHASKQVQKVQDSPPLFRTTYLGHHTCKNLFKPPHHHLIIQDPTPPDSSIIWSFGRGDSVKHEQQLNEDVDDDGEDDDRDRDYYMVPNDVLTEAALDGAEHLPPFSSGSDHGEVMSSDVYSCSPSPTTTTNIHDLDAIVGYEDFWKNLN